MSWCAVFLASAPLAAAGQAAVGGTDTLAVTAEPGDARGAARSLQAAFERARARHIPLTFGSAGGDCDEIVGRMCTWYGEAEWYPTPEPDEVGALRSGLAHGLDSLQALVPGDAWVLGQRVWTRGEGGDWEGALRTSRECAGASRWWCSALEGLSLHALGRYVDAEGAFERSLDEMDPEVALEWRVPERAVDRDAREILATLVTAADGFLDIVLDRLWALADPLYLVEGNDRRSAHYARWTVATLKDGARNPYRLRWGPDLEELTVRHGWEVGWERSRGRTLGGPDDVTGHKDPEGRDYLPSGRALADPSVAEPGDLVADRRRPRSLYAPPYAPVLLPMEGQLALFPRGDRLVVVSTHFLPEDTTLHALHEHPRPWMEPGDQTGMPDRIGLFAVPIDGGRTFGTHALGSVDGALMLDVPVGAWVISAESWSPERRRAGRFRLGLERLSTPPGVATLSDILLLARSPTTPPSLEDALPLALPSPEIDVGQGLAIAWEVSGLALGSGALLFEVSVERTGRGVFRRLGEILRLATPPASMSLSWEEPSPDRDDAHFHHLDLALPPLDPGTYTLTLTLRTQGRSDAVTRREFRVRG